MPAIEMRIDSLPQLFDSLDPAPFHDRALDREAEAWLRESVVVWVGLWRLAEMLLFERLENSADRAVLRRLSRIPVRFRAQADASALPAAR